MAGTKIQSLNYAIENAIPAMVRVADENPNADLQLRVLTFSSGASWHVEHPTPVRDFHWSPLDADGITDLGKALDLLCDALELDKMPPRGLPPVVVLLSDGQPTDQYQAALERLKRLPWGSRAVRIAIAIGDDADLNVLQQFMGGDPRETKPLVAKNAPDLVKFIKWATTVPVSAVSRPATRSMDSTAPGNVDIPAPPLPTSGPVDPSDVF
jgi:uncharacterized protein YegL